MTPVGHSLTGIAIAAVASSPQWTKKNWAVALPSFVILANAPDLPFPNWGHDRYEVSHSIFVTGLCVAILFSFHLAVKQVSTRVAFAACIAWLSHLFLDSLYGHGKGIKVMWPFGEGRLNFPIPWFETLRTPIDWFSAHSAKVFVIEFAFYGPVPLIAILLATHWRRYKSGHSDTE